MLEHLIEIGLLAKAEEIGYFPYVHLRIDQQIASRGNADLLDVERYRLTGFLLEDSTNIIRRSLDNPAQLLHRDGSTVMVKDIVLELHDHAVGFARDCLRVGFLINYGKQLQQDAVADRIGVSRFAQPMLGQQGKSLLYVVEMEQLGYPMAGMSQQRQPFPLADILKVRHVHIVSLLRRVQGMPHDPLRDEENIALTQRYGVFFHCICNGAACHKQQNVIVGLAAGHLPIRLAMLKIN